MTFAEVIQNNYSNCLINWWCRYAFHYTDVSNAINILKTGKLYSRITASNTNLMVNDNASNQVIDMTNESVLSKVRFYFRPLTPTQYYNEGYKHKQLRYSGDLNANIPIPIFFAFNLEKILSCKNVTFSSFSQAGYGSSQYSTVEEFSKLEFEKIYSDGFVDTDTKKYRHAEIMIPNEYNIDDSIEAILCRNDVDKTTLLNLLAKNDQKAFYKYKEKIKVCKEKMFYKNGLFLDNIYFDFNNLSITFADTFAKRSYERKIMKEEGKESLDFISAEIKLEWMASNNIILLSKSAEFKINYLMPLKTILKNIPKVPKAKSIAISIYVDSCLIGYTIYNYLENSVII